MRGIHAGTISTSKMLLQDDHTALLALYDAAHIMLATHDEAWLRALPPSVSAWSPAQHLAHIEAVNKSVLAALRQLERSGTDATPEPGKPRGLQVLAEGVFPRGLVRAPDFASFPPDLPLGTLRADLDRNRARWQALDLGAVAAWTATLPHPLLGPFTAPQWVRFARVHTTHHHAIIAEMTA